MTHVVAPAAREAYQGRAPSEPGFTLEVEHLTKRYGDSTVVDDLSFVARPGRVTGFLGPNGSGKSTTMKIMLDLASAEGGRATIGGQRYRDLDDPAATVGALLESNAFHPGRSGRNHLRVLADADGVEGGRVDEVLELVNLGAAADRRVGGYSLGMRQRLGFAAALLGDPPVLVLDEPANGLDPQGIHEMRDLLRSRAAEGHTVLVSSHLLAEVELLADDVIVIHRGRLVTSGSLQELQEEATLVRAVSTAELERVLEASGAIVESAGDNTLVVRGLSIDDIGERAFAANATMGASLFGAMAVAREYAHGTVIPTFLSSPRRHRAVLAQFGAVAIVAAILGMLGAVLTVAAVALALPTTEYGFLVSGAGVAQVVAASTFAGAVGGVLGAGIGAIIRNTGGAVAGTFFALMIAPPLIVQMANEANSWVPSTLVNVLSGVESEVAAVDQVGIPAAVIALAAWAVVPAAIGLLLVQRRDIV
jgi:ABC-2 type transport system ATP-binding protein